MNAWGRKRERISTFDFRFSPNDTSKSIAIWWEADKSEFIVRDEFTGLAVTCSTFDLGWKCFCNWVYERLHSPLWKN